MQKKVISLECAGVNSAIAHITKAGRIASQAIRRRNLTNVIALLLCRLTPELRRAALRPCVGENLAELTRGREAVSA